MRPKGHQDSCRKMRPKGHQNSCRKMRPKGHQDSLVTHSLTHGRRDPPPPHSMLEHRRSPPNDRGARSGPTLNRGEGGRVLGSDSARGPCAPAPPAIFDHGHANSRPRATESSKNQPNSRNPKGVPKGLFIRPTTVYCTNLEPSSRSTGRQPAAPDPKRIAHRLS